MASGVAPLAHTADVARVLCEVELEVGVSGVRPVSIRWA